MSEETLAALRLQGGRYEGILTAPVATEIELLHGGSVIAVADLRADPDRAGTYRVSADLPASVLSDGVQVVALRSAVSGVVLDRITLMSGAMLDEDIRAEMALLRDELEMLKRAFRRHCAETGQD